MSRTTALVAMLAALLIGVVSGGAYGYRVTSSVKESLTIARGGLQAIGENDPTSTPPASQPTPVVAAGATSAAPANATPQPTPRPLAQLPSVDQLEAACQRAGNAEGAMSSIGAGGLGLALDAASRLPLLGGRADAASDLLLAGRETSEGLSAMCDGMQPLLDIISQGGSGSSGSTGQVAVDALKQGRPKLEAAAAKLADARSRVDTLTPAQMRALGTEGERAALTLRQRLPQLELATQTLLVVPTLLGGDGPKRYLVLTQNNDELRPSGGFVGTAGIMQVEAGSVTSFTVSQSPDFDLPSSMLVKPPGPLSTYLNSHYWQLRDANWWPDFPSSVSQVEYFWKLLGKEPLDGVIALDQTAVELLLQAIGAVDVPEYGERIDAANMRRRLDAYTHSSGAFAEEDRKTFVAALSRAVLREMTQASPQTALAAGSALRTALDEKHMQIYSHSDDASRTLDQAGWDGSMLPPNGGDYLYVLHNNLTPNKFSREIEHSLEYAVERDGDTARAHLRIHYKSYMQPPAEGEVANPYLGRADFYRDYLRIYVPAGSTLESNSGFVEQPIPATECGLTSFSGPIELQPEQTMTVELVYHLPGGIAASLADGSYHLTVQKQPGTYADALSVGTSDFGKVEDSLYLDRFLHLDQGRLVLDEGPRAAQPAGSGKPVCDIQADPPTLLAPPQRVVIEKARIDAKIVDLGIEPDGTMQIPDDGDVVGWYASSAFPGWPGNSVFAGHVDWQKQIAVFWGLRNLVEGDPIKIQTADGVWKTYVVEHNWMVPFDAPARDIVGPTYNNWLTLITCDGEFDQQTHNYLNRRVVRAVLASDQGT